MDSRKIFEVLLDGHNRLRVSASSEKVKASRKPKSDECKLAEADEKLLTARLSDAKARDKGQAILAEAKDEAKAGPAETSMVATVIADRLGAVASNVARNIALVLTGLGVAVTQLVALLGGHAASLIGGALQARPKPRAKAKKHETAAGGQRSAARHAAP